MKRDIIAISVLVAFLASSIGRADEKSMIFSLTGYPGTTAQAQTSIDRFLRHAERLFGWPASSASGAFYPDAEQGGNHLKTDSPGFAVVTPDVYLRHGQGLKMQIIGKVKAANRGEEKFSVVVMKGKGLTLEGLKGKKVTGAVLCDPRFVTNIVFGGKLKAQDIVIVPQSKPLSGLRELSKGQVDAAVVDESVVKHMDSLPFGKDLEVIHASPVLPPPVIVAMPQGKNAIALFKSKLAELCGSAQGKPICEAILLESVEPATDAEYAAIRKLYNK